MFLSQCFLHKVNTFDARLFWPEIVSATIDLLYLAVGPLYCVLLSSVYHFNVAILNQNIRRLMSIAYFHAEMKRN